MVLTQGICETSSEPLSPENLRTWLSFYRMPKELIQQHTKEHLNHIGTKIRVFRESKGGDKRRVKRAKGVGEGTGGRRGKKGGNKWGPKAHSKNSDFGTPMI